MIHIIELSQLRIPYRFFRMFDGANEAFHRPDNKRKHNAVELNKKQNEYSANVPISSIPLGNHILLQSYKQPENVLLKISGTLKRSNTAGHSCIRG